MATIRRIMGDKNADVFDDYSFPWHKKDQFNSVANRVRANMKKAMEAQRLLKESDGKTPR